MRDGTQNGSSCFSYYGSHAVSIFKYYIFINYYLLIIYFVFRKEILHLTKADGVLYTYIARFREDLLDKVKLAMVNKQYGGVSIDTIERKLIDSDSSGRGVMGNGGLLFMPIGAAVPASMNLKHSNESSDESSEDDGPVKFVNADVIQHEKFFNLPTSSGLCESKTGWVKILFTFYNHRFS